MNCHIGLAFTPEQINFASFLNEADSLVLDQVGQIEHFQQYSAESFFDEKNIPALVDSLNQSFRKFQIDITRFSVSLESNLALLKRVMFPANLDKSGRQDHLKWDLAENLTLPISQYVYFQSSNKYVFKNFEEELVVAVPKKIVSFIKQLATGLDAELVTLSIHHLAAELILQNVLAGQPEKLVMLQKLAHNRAETSFYLNGTYFSSYYEQIPQSNEISAHIDRLKSKTSFIENLFGQYGEDKTLVDRILLYGDRVDDTLVGRIQKNMSVPVDRFNAMQNLNLSDSLKNLIDSDNEQMKYVECIGIALDI